MKKGTRCIVQTINLSNPKTCVRPKQVQKLVSADVADSRPDPNRISNYWAPRPVTVKICTRKDMQRTCQPKFSDCPERPLPLSSGEKLCKTVMFLLKSAIAAGLVYWTYSEGLWSDSTKTEDLYYRMINTLILALSDRPDVDNTHSPDLKEIKCSALEAYNRTLMKVMDTVVTVPLEMRRKLRDLLFPCDATKETGTTFSTHFDDNPMET